MRGSLLVGVLVVSVSLLGCRGSAESRPESTPPREAPTAEVASAVLSPTEVEMALLTVGDLGLPFRQSGFWGSESDSESFGLLKSADGDSGDNTGGGSPGCLSALDVIEGPEPETDAAVEFDDGLGSSVFNVVGSFASADDVSRTLANLVASLEGCTSVNENQDGVQFSLEVTVDDDKASSAVDEQLNVIASGTGSSEGVEIPIAVGLSLVRLDNNLTGVGFSEFGGNGATVEYTDKAIAGLDAVMKGEPLPAGE